MENKATGDTGSIASTAVKPEIKKDKRVKGYKIAIITLCVVIVGLIGFLIYHFAVISHDEKECDAVACELIEDEETGETVKVIKVPVGNSEEDVAVREMAGKLFKVASGVLYGDPDRGWTPGLIRSYNELRPLYRPEGVKTSIVLDLAYGFSVVQDKDATFDDDKVLRGGLSKALEQELTKNGFKRYEYGSSRVESYINEQSGIVCAYSYYVLPFDLGCSSVNWYSNTEEWDLLNELVEAYKKKTGEEINLYASVENIKNSSYEPYQILTGGTNGGWLDFYRVSPESEWQLFGSGSNGYTACEEYNTEDLKRAFVGEPCWNEATQQNDTVKL